jgi:L-ribulose-5-phosphate 4-epimerase
MAPASHPMFGELKREVYQANVDLVAHSLVTLTWGNVSGLSPDRRWMAIKPSGVPYRDLCPELMVVVDMESGEVAEGSLRPSSDTSTHRYLYQHFHRIGGITHTHSPRATAFAQAQRPLPCFGTTHADHFYGTVPVTRPLSPVEVADGYELNTGKVIVETFAELDPLAIPAVLVALHAPFTWGLTASQSLENAIALEAVAGMALDTLALAPSTPEVAPYLLEKHYFRKHGDDAYYGQAPG